MRSQGRDDAIPRSSRPRTVQGEIASWLNDHTFIVCPLKVSNDRLDCGGVALLRIMRESRDLTDRKRNVGVGICREVDKHPDHRTIAPRLLHWRTGGVNSQSCLSSRSPIAVIQLHPRCLLDLLNQAFLRERQSAVFGVLYKVDSQEVSEGSFLSETETFGVEIFK